MKFSERAGINPVQKAIQIESIDIDLRNTLWSVLTAFYWESFNLSKHGTYGRTDEVLKSNLAGLFRNLWLGYFKQPTDTIPKLFYDNALPHLRDYFFNAKWYEVFDFIEFISEHGPKSSKSGFADICNKYLAQENSGYRFVEDKIVEISSTEEVSEIENALEQSIPYYGVREHLKSAIFLMSNKENPDFRNSIKESISAVESLCVTVIGNDKATLGEALKVLEKNGLLHPALKAAFSSLYGYTSDAEGIRHALMSESNLTKTDARFMVISCSAFINYVIASIAK